mmetsp:Transcript_20374/g.61390  ORF Transcript_20374/g.61390 Transcript_20374/m.61390 type:complete len:84 (-) Transcript_20374:304-555(-)|eukprot:CAMPEP_0206150446 /NCGR_PEP_ID=MMETSP1473-20131121/38305_1 /ASSEMBLY_ACC=CAM_ASM_001109 /TAXON_ID=1461547 /ORGANISM="Stichococcus sp, Strain RCC1054" /LENGTH=83 /DNA_ID=CAMNT_0053547949 /DNA_START=274 /DNA_END=525 /DNA_ORIENTATION=-
MPDPAPSTAKPAEEPKAAEEPPPQLEEDDEFEEFDTEDWSPAEEDPNVEKLWEDDWDDDNVGDDFTARLRAELGLKPATAAAQ